MTEQEAIAKMVAPGMRRPGKYMDGIIQLMITRSCNQSCTACTQGSNLGGKPAMMTLEQFDKACQSLRGYFGLKAVFGGDPCTHPRFVEICAIMRRHFKQSECGLWANDPITPANAQAARITFSGHFSNINCHLDRKAFDMWRQHWPECRPFGVDQDSRHSPPFVAMKDVVADEGERWGLISGCDINRQWSAIIGVFRDQLRGFFCEIAYAQAAIHAHEPDYPDTGFDPTIGYHEDGMPGGNLSWWQLPMTAFASQVRKHCHDCGIPLRGWGGLAMDDGAVEQVSPTHAAVFKPKQKSRRVELVTVREQLGPQLKSAIDYIGNAVKPKQQVVR